MQKIHNSKIHTHNKWRKRYQCKKTKGKHIWEVVYAKWWDIMGWTFINYQCVQCGKEKTEVLYK